ncbi:MAG: hypothetical protein HUK14_11110 [Muribaculaceae bacterium]|nr:hypothetical protein [Muribaculaceae bacterium]
MSAFRRRLRTPFVLSFTLANLMHQQYILQIFFVLICTKNQIFLFGKIKHDNQPVTTVKKQNKTLFPHKKNAIFENKTPLLTKTKHPSLPPLRQENPENVSG